MAAMRLTLDTNCVIDVEEERPNAPYIRQLVSLHGGSINVAVSAIGASERQRAGGYAESFEEFQSKLASAGFGAVEILLPPAYFDICFFDHCVFADDDTLEEAIHDVLFPNIEFHWPDFAAAHRVPLDGLDKGWRNAKCDVLGLWCHVKSGGDVFVTSDGNFHVATKRAALLHLGAGAIAYPKDAVAMATAQ